jgi:hypothetical protein
MAPDDSKKAGKLAGLFVCWENNLWVAGHFSLQSFLRGRRRFELHGALALKGIRFE